MEAVAPLVLTQFEFWGAVLTGVSLVGLLWVWARLLERRERELPAPVSPAELLGLSKDEVAAALVDLDREFPTETPALAPSREEASEAWKQMMWEEELHDVSPLEPPCPYCHQLRLPHGCCLTPPPARPASPVPPPTVLPPPKESWTDRLEAPVSLVGRVVRIPIDGEDMACRVLEEDERSGKLRVCLLKHDKGSGPSVWLPKEVVEDRPVWPDRPKHASGHGME